MKVKKQKYNSSDLLLHIPQNSVITSVYLRNVGISDRMMFYYTKNLNLFKSIGQGAYIRRGDKPNWMGGIYALQLFKNVHVGGLTSLQLLGLSHFLRFNYPIHLYSYERFPLPKWLAFFKSTKIKLFNANFIKSKEGIIDYNAGSFTIKISSLERAILEYLYLCPHKTSLKEAYQIMEMAIGFRPKLVQKLLESSTSIKANRLFLFLAEKCNHDWLKFVNTSKVKLGTSKWTITKGGKFNIKYKITIPKDIEKI